MAITLIGLPSSGKSTLGVLLAKALGLSFVDTDLVIQEKEGALLHEIIENKGAEGFLEIENKIISELDADNCVIATGGSAVFGKEAMSHLHSLGKIVYLKITYGDLEKRLGDYTHRGVVMKNGETLRDLYNTRVPLYEEWADVTIDSTDTTYNTVKKLTEVLK
ncbi:MAG: shikimate kinase [Clostridia bacterium]|nr:shikimate kinase [Clostridia bacterium]